MSTLADLLPAETRAALLAAVGEVRAELAALRPLAFALQTDDTHTPLQLAPDFLFHPLPGDSGFALARLLAPAGRSATLLRGPAGALSPRYAAPVAVAVTVQAGALLWWQESFGAYGAPENYRRLGPGDSAALAPGEGHTYLCLEECLAYNLFTPALPDA